MQPGGDDQERGRLAWRCRRGMKELDLLLLDYLQRDWPLASASERGAFARILELPDPVLAAYLLGHAECTEPELAPLLATLQTLAGRRHASGAGRNPAGSPT
jgi:antitoxin CptB